MYKLLKSFLILCALTGTVYSDDDFRCDPIVTDYEAGELVTDLKEYCKTTPCMYKRCPPNHVLFRGGGHTNCKTFEDIKKLSNRTLDFSIIDIVYKFYNNRTKDRSQNKTITNDFKFLNLKNITSNDCKYSGWTTSTNDSSYHVLETGSLLIERPNFSPRFVVVPAGGFVFDVFVKQINGTFVGPMFVMRTIETKNDNIFADINGIGMLISSFFMVLFLIVFWVLPYLRTLANRILMTFVASLLVGFLFMAMHSLDRGELMSYPYFCEITSVIMYFALLSSYFWMNVIAFDIFWAIRANYKLHPTNRRGINHKYRMYCLYAFGIPFLVTALALIIDHLDLSSTPDVVRIGFDTCLRSPDAVNMYIYTPIAIVIAINVMLFLLTVFNIWRVRRALHTTEDSCVKRNENRFYVYFKLSLITGVHWVLDITMAFADVPRWMEYVSSVYNVLIGVVIFVLYVCKKKYLRDLCKRFSIGSSLIKWMDRKKTDFSPVISRSGTERSTRTDQTEPEHCGTMATSM